MRLIIHYAGILAYVIYVAVQLTAVIQDNSTELKIPKRNQPAPPNIIRAVKFLIFNLSNLGQSLVLIFPGIHLDLRCMFIFYAIEGT